MTELNFYLQKFCINFGDSKHIKTQISPKKSMSNACSKPEQCLYTSDSHTLIGKHEQELDEKDFCKFAKLVSTTYRRAISAIKNIKFLLWFVWVTSCFNSGTIQCSPLKILRVGESLLNGQACDFSRFFQDSSFWKLPERSHPIFTCSKPRGIGGKGVGVFLIFVTRVKWLSYRMSYN